MAVKKKTAAGRPVKGGKATAADGSGAGKATVKGRGRAVAGRPVKGGKAAAADGSEAGKVVTVDKGVRRAAVAGKPARRVKAEGGSAESTEERIKQAARKLFTQKGFAAVRTRDIAKEAGINLALLNYYFRSKQKLFDLVMMENFRKFLSGMTVNFQDPMLSIEDRLGRIVTAYVDFLTEFPDLPLFILNEIRGNPSKIAEQIRQEVGPARSAFFKELQEAKNEGRIELDPAHFVMNLVGLTVFPFVARPLLLRVTGVSDEQFLALMEERKRLVPKWIKMMMTMGLTSKK